MGVNLAAAAGAGAHGLVRPYPLPGSGADAGATRGFALT